MCIAIPGKVKAIINENTATVDMGGVRRDVNMDLLGGASEALLGKYVLVHVGYAISEISEEEGEETMRLLKLMAGLDDGELGFEETLPENRETD
ncbi:[NiFe] hydrogenase metallocenter assembly protein HypC [Methanosarcina sp. MTP4]|uniref:HypC/HybG/HupF family hydrogenase formation chaperone n=1 Tax=Methanosarcina sp. MTP4 TaxID=1434100 RepID=UPI000615EC52|nr:HypC/HybG/HupF family hydrogenase formation chaperone [Methanosarcina sp. MTP4]AKB25901.1 [NiFe] hydrogenase metallocenter assembly protein HypC [Methanosarcina sp. MTP4]